MEQLNRRDFIKLAGMSLLSRVAPIQGNVALHRPAPMETRQSSGSDLSGWKTVLGDGLYTAPGVTPVNQTDIESVHYGTYSELRANIYKRRVMAHNITYQRVTDSDAFNFIHTFEFTFQLPYIPTIGNTDLNAQTIEGGLFIWDGGNTRLDYGVGFQWYLNPWDGLGELRCWSDVGGVHWQPIGRIEPDTAWHKLRMVVDYKRQTTALVIDDKHYPCCFTGTPKSADWGNGTEVGGAGRNHQPVAGRARAGNPAQGLFQGLVVGDGTSQWTLDLFAHDYQIRDFPPKAEIFHSVGAVQKESSFGQPLRERGEI